MDVRRYFVDVGDRQALYRSLGDPALPPLVMFHGSPGSSFSLMPLARHLAAGRRIVALDTPGNGDSSPAPMDEPTIGDYAEMHLAAIDAIGLETVDLYGYHTGASIAIELSIRHPDRVRRIVLDGVSLFDAAAQRHLLGNDHAPHIVPDHEGSQLSRAFIMVRDAWIFWPWWARGGDKLRGLGLPDTRYLHDEVLEVLKSVSTYHLSYRAALRYPKHEQLPKVPVPALVAACPSDQLYEYLDKVAALIPGARKAETPGATTEAERAKTAEMFLAFLDG